MKTTILRASSINDLTVKLNNHTKPRPTYTIAVVSIGGVSVIDGEYLLPIVTKEEFISGAIQPNK